jgi:hypothetical protein
MLPVHEIFSSFSSLDPNSQYNWFRIECEAEPKILIIVPEPDP